MKYYALTVLTLFILSGAFFIANDKVTANGFGIKLDQAVGEYIVNVDADTYTLVSQEPVTLMFMLWNKDRTEAVDFDDVWVSITPEGSFINTFGGLLGKPGYGGFRMSYVFPKPGNYTIRARYDKKTEDGSGTAIAEAYFPITVEKGDQGGYLSPVQNGIVWGLAGFIAGISVVSWIKRK